MAVGAPEHGSGMVYVYSFVPVARKLNDISLTTHQSNSHRSLTFSSNWELIGGPIHGAGDGDAFGFSVSLRAFEEVLRVIISAKRNDDIGIDSGNVIVLEWNNSDWLQVGSTMYGDDAGDHFGHAVAVNKDGSIIAVGSIDHMSHGGLQHAGQVKVFYFNQTYNDWDQIGGDIEGLSAFDNFGLTVALSDDGLTLAVGSTDSDAGGLDSGSVRVFKWNQSKLWTHASWTQIGSAIDGEYPEDLSGRGLALNALGDRLAIGAIENDDGGTDAGQVREFDITHQYTPTPTNLPTQTPTYAPELPRVKDFDLKQKDDYIIVTSVIGAVAGFVSTLLMIHLLVLRPIRSRH